MNIANIKESENVNIKAEMEQIEICQMSFYRPYFL